MPPFRHHRLVVAAALAVFLGRIVATYPVFNDTFDEAGHLRAGLELLQKRRYTIQAEQPPLGTAVLAALPYALAGLRLSGHNELLGRGPWGTRETAYYWRTLALARAGNLLWAAVLFWFVWRFSRDLYGDGAAAAAAALVACCPSVIALASLATLDIGSAATVVMAAYYFRRWSREPGYRYCLASAAAFGLAALTKISALFFLPLILAAYFLAARRGPSAAGARQAAVFTAAAFLVIWAGYLFEVGEIIPDGHHYTTQFDGGMGKGPPRLLLSSLGTTPLPAHRFLHGIIEVLAHNQQGHRAYLLGQVSWSGWWYYFPVALAVKATLPLLALAALGTALAPRAALYPLLAAAAVLAPAMTSHLNIGVRYVLAVFPMLAVAASGVFAAKRPRWLAAAALGLIGWHAAESIAAHPDYLPYFNQVARGREDQFLADSNLDWGQDLARLARYLDARGIETVHLEYFGATKPERLGIRAAHPHPGERPEGWTAVSLSSIATDPEGLGWLRERRPEARIGKSILLFRGLGPPPPAP